MKTDRRELLEMLKKQGWDGEIPRNTLLKVSKANGFAPPAWLMNGEKFRVRSGIVGLHLVTEDDISGERRARAATVRVPAPTGPIKSEEEVMEERAARAREKAAVAAVTAPAPSSDALILSPAGDPLVLRQARLEVEYEDLVPTRDDTFVPYGFFPDMVKLVASRRFFTVYIKGLHGGGKTLLAREAAARTGREFVRVQITGETDEDDLMGGMVLVNGSTVYRKGPVLVAMERGAVLGLDEYDRGGPKMMCMQGVLEGEPYLVKATGEVIYPSPGFMVVATANTDGRGSDDGRYVSAQVQDDAQLDRFHITVEHDYPDEKTELRIVLNKMARAGRVDEDFARKLVQWASLIRKTYMENAIEDLLSTRRLDAICRVFSVYGQRMKTIEYCVARFNEATRMAFKQLYQSVDEKAKEEEQAAATTNEDGDEAEIQPED